MAGEHHAIDFARYRRIKASRQGRVLTLALSNPQLMNAVDGEMHRELSEIFLDAARDEGSDVVILTGEGAAFSAGGDLNWMKRSFEKGEAGPDAAEAKRIVFSLLDLEKPIIAKVRGPAVGLGATLALMCDVIFAGESARFADPHVRAGIVAGDGGAIIWPQLVGYARAKEYLMTGDPVPAREAERIGLVNHVVPDDELDARVDVFAARLAGGAIMAIKYSKVAVNIGLKQLAHSILDASVAYEMQTFATEDHREAVHAFLEKRKPVFKGR
ncbi:MAG TPA: enoyl-CoA hydratase-related protein [Parvibaculum sp.]|uniref:enoyl-CoA hydratase/isomerase family protein n=1 Tax=Parvibaculum sp. TaxID=2024848 RepID=UPI002B58DEDC|nr:enoyl-CoA hydratase-related protein [Parvibaculum sp.]HMM15619.1 enoyl-CoA hydratase-related protein [Parvibaculum sp.]